MEYTLGLDLGIGSVGWAVIQNDVYGAPCKIENLGVRIFDEAEVPKTGASLAADRREARGTRRRIRRRRHRKERIKALLVQYGLMSREAMDAMFEASGFEKDVYTLRAEGLDRRLEASEWVRVLVHLAQRRGYRSNSTSEAKKSSDTGAVKRALSENKARMQEHGYRTVGEMFCKDGAFWTTSPGGMVQRKTRNTPKHYEFTVERSMIEDEVEQLFMAQREQGNPFTEEAFQERYRTILFSQRGFDEGPGEIAPGQGNPYMPGDRRGMCTFEREKRAFKACYTFEYFKLMQDLNHIRILAKGEDGRPLTQEERETLIALVKQPTKAKVYKSLTYQQLRKALALPEDHWFNTVNYQNEKNDPVEKKTLFPELQSYHKMRIALDAVEPGYIGTLTEEQLDAIAEVLSLYKGDARRREKLQALSVEPAAIEALLPLSFTQAGHLSLTAMKKLIPYLETGMTYDRACKEVYGDHRGSEKPIRRKTISLNPELRNSGALDDLSNPVVLRAVSQTCKVVSAIVRRYGSPQMIRLELAREMSKTHDERDKIEKSYKTNQENNEKARQAIEDLKGGRATGQDIVKWKLWKEQDGVCLYSGRQIEVNRLFEPGYVDVDHIVPYSISFDDSYMNKVLVMSAENRQKGNRLPLTYLGADTERGQEFVTRVKSLPYRKRQRLLKPTLTEADTEGFKERNLNDTRYITRAVYNLFREHLEFAPSRYEKKPVQAVNGVVTDYMRKRFGLKKNRDNGDLHHAMDAAVVAIVTEGMIQRISNYAKRREKGQKVLGQYVDYETGELLSQADFDAKYAPTFPEPWPGFRKELEARLSPDPREEITAANLPNYDPQEEVRPIFVSRMPKRKVTGPAHKETIRKEKERETKHLIQTPRGWAEEGSMIRIDVFHVSGEGYYFIPVYISQTTQRDLPQKAVIANTKEEEWKVMKEEDFLFSLYPGDLIRVEHKKGIKVTLPKKRQGKADGEPELTRKEWMLYYVSADRSTGSISAETHDRKYKIKSLGFKKLLKVEKYEVDVLGEIHKVHTPEVRQDFQGKRR